MAWPRKKKKTLALNDTLNRMDLDTYRTFHPKATEYTFFSNVPGTFSRIDHMLSHKTTLNEFKKTEIIPCIFSNHNCMKLEINYKKKTGKFTAMCRLNYMLLTNQWVKEEIKKMLCDK